MLQVSLFFLIFNFLIFINLNRLSKIININDKPDGKLHLKKHKYIPSLF